MSVLTTAPTVGPELRPMFRGFCARIWRTPRFWRVWRFRGAREHVAGEMWEPAFGAGFQAPRANQESQVSYSSPRPRRAISTAKQRILPIFFEIGYSASPMG